MVFYFWFLVLVMPDSPELTELINLISKDEKLTAMFAPSFPIDFPFPEIVGKLKRVGFSYVVEVARGAVETNRQVVEDLKSNPKKRIITSPCPSCVRYIKAQRPELASFLSTADSPMRATAKLIKQKFPNTKPVFIGPCLTKKLEAQDHPELDILVITFKELAQLFDQLKIPDSTEDLIVHFDLLGPTTRLYPISGGLCQTAGIDELLAKDQWRMDSGLELLKDALDDFSKNKELRVLDILFCDGGCINGPGIISKDPLGTRRQKVIKFWVVHPSVKG